MVRERVQRFMAADVAPPFDTVRDRPTPVCSNEMSRPTSANVERLVEAVALEPRRQPEETRLQAWIPAAGGRRSSGTCILKVRRRLQVLGRSDRAFMMIEQVCRPLSLRRPPTAALGCSPTG